VKTLRTTDVARAAGILRGGGLVAFPTETVYGLGADGLDAAAVRRIFAAKGRPGDNPLILHVGSPAEAAVYGALGDAAAALAARFWPGPLTLVVPARAGLPAELRAGLATVALRCPEHPMARNLLAAAGRPLAAPSANRSGRPSPTSADAVLDDLDGRIDAVLDGGPCPRGLESTVLDCTGREPVILRLGALPAEALGLAPRTVAAADGRSPGTRHRHYAPALPVVLCGDLAEGLRRHPDAAVLWPAAEAAALGLRPGPAVHWWSDRPEGRAAELFAALRRLERSGRPCILAPVLDARGLDAATMDRLRRAAGGP
jgi:L-threonylcarbamoyladenylate synthase